MLFEEQFCEIVPFFLFFGSYYGGLNFEKEESKKNRPNQRAMVTSYKEQKSQHAQLQVKIKHYAYILVQIIEINKGHV